MVEKFMFSDSDSEWLGGGLQNRLSGFDSHPGLQFKHGYPSGLRDRSAKPAFIGSNPIPCSK